MQRHQSTEERFWAKVEAMPSGCWGWRACLDSHGYGRFGMDGKSQYAHRLSYEFMIGPIPLNMTIDHLCRNRACVNPNHLEPVSLRVNLLRGVGVGAVNAQKEECLRGHRLEGENVYLYDGRRYCRACRQAYAKAGWASRDKLSSV